MTPPAHCWEQIWVVGTVIDAGLTPAVAEVLLVMQL